MWAPGLEPGCPRGVWFARRDAFGGRARNKVGLQVVYCKVHFHIREARIKRLFIAVPDYAKLPTGRDE